MEKGNSRCIYDAVSSNAAILFFVGAVTIVIIRVLYVMYRSSNPPRPKSPRPLSTLIVLGSGGHTAEMMNLLSVLQEDRFKPRFYIAAATDNMSLQKARVFEDSLVQKAATEVVGTAQFMQIYRSREILCNGPGTCIPICAIAFIFKVLGVKWSSIFYVESIARVKRLSLSGLLLYKLHMADQLFVQWPQLKSQYPRAHYVGRLM
ncbi:UDP-N-acetylglucosamine transferase subunit ALG14 homolog isoform X2 [Ipomoea triloba]|uniref:UDP-N-acetylglucosamine transferase subunit ALG14 homolog isoform X2 n=1 Tax=Ipomoea triloba TaxID=35885 RepID=UPI00125CF111|nr:UDP-N-acetylglucosamine transferase subunit ALG14 homolog isoform X2 [Ipomoea triloba]